MAKTFLHEGLYYRFEVHTEERLPVKVMIYEYEPSPAGRSDWRWVVALPWASLEAFHQAYLQHQQSTPSFESAILDAG